MVLAKSRSLSCFPEDAVDAWSRGFWAQVEVVGDDACWRWKSKVIMTAGYGQVRFLDGKKLGAHRASYLITHGCLSEGKVIRHLCHNKLCVNPSHLREGSYRQNWEDEALKYLDGEAAYYHDLLQREFRRAGHTPDPDEDVWADILG